MACHAKKIGSNPFILDLKAVISTVENISYKYNVAGSNPVLLYTIICFFMISLLISLPLIGIIIIFFIKESNFILIKKISMFFSLVSFIYSLFFWVYFDQSNSKFQYVEYFEWLSLFNMNFFLGIDGISLFFIILTTLLISVCILASWNNVNRSVKEYFICFLLIESFLIVIFSSLDLILFYIFFESVLIPMFFIIGIWGSRTRKIKAAFQFFLFTLVGSLFMLLAIFIILFECGSLDFQILNTISFTVERQIFLWLAFFLSFSVKIPMVPVHIWLPEAHVEAPTAGSVILAGILLKLGSYGFLRFSLNLFPCASLYFTPLIFVLSVIAIFYTSCITLRQVDLKKIIAYSSVAHMGFVTIGIFSANVYSIEGSIIIMISHGFISSALFLCIGVLYERHHTRLLKYYSGLSQVMPLFSFLFCFFSLANLGFPGFSSFIGEFLTLLGAFHKNILVSFLASIGMILGTSYSLWLCNRLVFGPLNSFYIFEYHDLTRREFSLFFPLILGTFFIGIYPEIFIETLHLSIFNILQKI